MISAEPLLKGHWLVRYDPQQIDYQRALDVLAGAQRIPVVAAMAPADVFVWIVDGGGNLFFRRKQKLFLRLTTTETDSWTEKCFIPPEDKAPLWKKNTGNVTLLAPRLRGDARWRTIDAPPAFLYLGSALRAAGWNVAVQTWAIDGALALDNDAAVCGISLYEDLLPAVQAGVRRLRAGYSGLIAAGGPFVTLSPLAAAYHLPEFNLFVRGEGESVFPKLLRALFNDDRRALRRLSGFFFQRPGLLWFGDYGHVNRMANFRGFEFNTSFLPDDRMAHGLELNLTRGCRRACLFCSHVHGRTLRKLPLVKAGRLLQAYRQRLAGNALNGEEAYSVNINDDDILQDREYALRAFRLIRTAGLRIWGVQTSPHSLFAGNHIPDGNLIAAIADADLYVGGRPLLWLGSDAFQTARIRRLAKNNCTPERLESLVAELEKRQVRNFHYWISSDAESRWTEFVSEFVWLVRMSRTYPHFALLAHAPFLIPYAVTPIYRQLNRSGRAARIRLRTQLTASHPLFDYPLVERVETSFANLNRLLANENPERGGGFFDSLRAKDFSAAARLAYYFLRQEWLQGGAEQEAALKPAQAALEDLLTELPPPGELPD